MEKQSSKSVVTLVLECIECGARSEEGQGWKAYLYEETPEVLVYCTKCAQREFEEE